MKWNFPPLLNSLSKTLDGRLVKYESLQQMLITPVFPPKNRSLPFDGWHRQQSWPPSSFHQNLEPQRQWSVCMACFFLPYLSVSRRIMKWKLAFSTSPVRFPAKSCWVDMEAARSRRFPVWCRQRQMAERQLVVVVVAQWERFSTTHHRKTARNEIYYEIRDI